MTEQVSSIATIVNSRHAENIEMLLKENSRKRANIYREESSADDPARKKVGYTPTTELHYPSFSISPSFPSPSPVLTTRIVSKKDARERARSESRTRKTKENFHMNIEDY